MSRLLLPLAFAASLTLIPSTIAAQQNVGINLFRGVVTLSGVLCGFDCGSATNIGRAAASVNDTIGIRLLGQDQFPAGVLIGAGPAFPCPGLMVPGVSNTLLVDPFSLLLVGSTPFLSGPARPNCGETANQVMFTFPLPFLPIGTQVHFQGVVFDGGLPTFTRAIELTIV